MQVIAKQQRVPLPPSEASPTDFDLISALLPHSAHGASNEEEELDDEDERRTATLLMLRLAYAQAHAQLASIAEEFELLRTAPPALPGQPGTSDRARSSPEVERTSWTLDGPRAAAATRRGGPLLDSAGKVRDPLVHFFARFSLTRIHTQPLQPFTILPSGAGGDRARLQDQVFQPDHRLPTMSIDEYLEIERQRGNILTGGG